MCVRECVASTPLHFEYDAPFSILIMQNNFRKKNRQLFIWFFNLNKDQTIPNHFKNRIS